LTNELEKFSELLEKIRQLGWLKNNPLKKYGGGIADFKRLKELVFKTQIRFFQLIWSDKTGNNMAAKFQEIFVKKWG